MGVRWAALRWFTAGLVVLAAAGCAQKTDWIEGTLVTVDVSGVWRGSGGMLRGRQGEIEITLKQRGARVSGDTRFRATKTTVDGTLRGDVLSLTEANGQWGATATVAGDEMTAVGWMRESAMFGEFRFKLWRQP